MANSQENPIILTPIQSGLDPEVVAASVQRSARFDGIAIGLGASALIAVSYFIIIGVSPFIAAAVVFLLLFPFREYRAARTIMFTAGVLVGSWMFVTLANLLFPFIIGLLLAYLFNPIVTWVDKNWKVKRGWSALFIVITLWGLITLLGILLIPKIIDQVQALLMTISEYFRRSSLTLDEQGIRNFFLSLGLSQKYVDQYVSGEIIPQVRVLLAALPKVIIIILTSIPGYAEHILDLIIIPVAAIYFLMDWHLMIQSIQELIPQRQRPAFITTFRSIDKVLYGYIRGQSTVAAIIGTLGAIIFVILGIPYAALLGLSIALLDLIPFVGLIISIIIVEGVILLTMHITFGSITIGIAVIAGLHLFENYFLGPKIVGKGVGIPPVLIIISIFVFGYFLGLLGLFIAVPLTGIILLFIREYRQALVEHPL